MLRVDTLRSINFVRWNILVSGVHTYPGDKVIYPGEAVVARIKFASWEFFGNDVKVGDVFEIRELDRVVGVGVVKEIF